MVTGEKEPRTPLLSRWLSGGGASAEAPPPRDAARKNPAAAPKTAPEIEPPPSPEALLADVLRFAADVLSPREVAFVSTLLDPVRAALVPGAKVAPEALALAFDQAEDVLEAFLIARAAEPPAPDRG